MNQITSVKSLNRLSKRASKIRPSATMALNSKTKKLKNLGNDIINMSVGEPDFEAPIQALFAAIQAITNGQTGYTPPAGIMELRQAIANYILENSGITFSPEQIITSAGGKQPLYNVFQVICDYDDEVILPSPYWVSYPEQIRLSGARPVVIQCNESTGFKLTAELLRESITQKTKAVVLTSPNNPTGSVYSEIELKEIGEVLLEYPNILIISDEIYDKFVYEGSHFSLPSIFPDLLNRTIITNGFSKVFSMPGWRLGYIAAPLDIAVAISNFQSHATGSPATISQYAGIAAIQNFDNKMVEEYKKRRDLLVNGLNEIGGIRCYMPEGAFYVFPNISNFIGKKYKNVEITSSDVFCSLLLEEQLLSVVPGEAFGEPNNIRLNFAVSNELIHESLNRLKNFTSLID
ncbi:pyridoxal phosphate-dependent aminotransferase [uncultured Rummeliibacillus sp.]|uniref:pyridoxal phosphate-dependent aminotransferase n=1 Tax=uncultured Rummeliibacillus sp. TaxID=762292 RepID=UPI0026399472|nr:pyridoxal phosphate-dependent aminotransferase [uncultured Rummeliibacillus sp.]